MRKPLRLLLTTLCLLQPLSAQEKQITIALVGDSTVTDNAGWGKAFAAGFDGSVEVLNFAAGGRSSKSWFDEKRLPAALAAKPDYVLIQFGHNDQPGKGPGRETDPATTYRDFLRMYVKEFRVIGAQPIIVSSVVRRHFDAEGKIRSNLAPWAEAAKAVATETGTPFIDLHTTSTALHNDLGPEASMAFSSKEEDLTHFNAKGAEAIAALILADLKTAVPALAPTSGRASDPSFPTRILPASRLLAPGQK